MFRIQLSFIAGIVISIHSIFSTETSSLLTKTETFLERSGCVTHVQSETVFKKALEYSHSYTMCPDRLKHMIYKFISIQTSSAEISLEFMSRTNYRSIFNNIRFTPSCTALFLNRPVTASKKLTAGGTFLQITSDIFSPVWTSIPKYNLTLNFHYVAPDYIFAFAAIPRLTSSTTVYIKVVNYMEHSKILVFVKTSPIENYFDQTPPSKWMTLHGCAECEKSKLILSEGLRIRRKKDIYLYFDAASKLLTLEIRPTHLDYYTTTTGTKAAAKFILGDMSEKPIANEVCPYRFMKYKKEPLRFETDECVFTLFGVWNNLSALGLGYIRQNVGQNIFVKHKYQIPLGMFNIPVVYHADGIRFSVILSEKDYQRNDIGTAMSSPFEKTIWLVFLANFVILNIFLKVATKKNECIFWTLSVLLEQGDSQFANKRNTVPALVVWLLGAIFVRNLYCFSLYDCITYITTPTNIPEIFSELFTASESDKLLILSDLPTFMKFKQDQQRLFNSTGIKHNESKLMENVYSPISRSTKDFLADFGEMLATMRLNCFKGIDVSGIVKHSEKICQIQDRFAVLYSLVGRNEYLGWNWKYLKLIFHLVGNRKIKEERTQSISQWTPRLWTFHRNYFLDTFQLFLEGNFQSGISSIIIEEVETLMQLRLIKTLRRKGTLRKNWSFYTYSYNVVRHQTLEDNDPSNQTGVMIAMNMNEFQQCLGLFYLCIAFGLACFLLEICVDMFRRVVGCVILAVNCS